MSDKPLRVSYKLAPAEMYRAHMVAFPVCAVDLVITDKKDRILLLKRNERNFAWKGQWGTPGGRVFRNEPLRNAAYRILLRETGLRIAVDALMFEGVQEVITYQQHGITNVFHATARTTNVVCDHTSSEAGWFEFGDLPESLRPQYRAIIRMGLEKMTKDVLESGSYA